MKNKSLKIVITLLLTLAGVMACVPFAKYFLLATQRQKLEIVTQKELPETTASTEIIHAPTFSEALELMDQPNQVEAIGRIVIPSVSIAQPILVGVTSSHLMQGVVTLFPQRQPYQSSLTLIGHHLRYDALGGGLLFGGIQTLNKGASVYLEYLGKSYQYEVSSNQLIRETDLRAVADQGPEVLFLVTCNEGVATPYRVLVTAKRVPSEGAATFEAQWKKSEQNYHSNYLWRFIVPFILLIIVYSVLLYVVWRMK